MIRAMERHAVHFDWMEQNACVHALFGSKEGDILIFARPITLFKKDYELSIVPGTRVCRALVSNYVHLDDIVCVMNKNTGRPIWPVDTEGNQPVFVQILVRPFLKPFMQRANHRQKLTICRLRFQGCCNT